MSTADQPAGTGSRLRAIEPQPRPRRKLTSRIGLLHVVALASGMLAFLLILTWMRAQEQVVEVAVATDTIRSGNVLDTALIEFVEVPAAGSFGDRLLSPDNLSAVAGSVATRQINPGEPVLDTDLRPVDTPEGLRAMSLPLQIDQAVSGDLFGGDRIDIIGFDDAGPRYVATDIEVLAVPGESSATFGATANYAITVAVDDVQALRIAAALDFGAVHVLRSTGAPQVQGDRLAADEPSAVAPGAPAEAGAAADGGG